ncbi:hypothetical protein [Lewinella sp. JB7]|uniref:hypothetical protein n=1 Tax=Lewinella sp. JB7 TaxID=2962887 RepID=UPI0020CA240C|nr:hypothetical protein [Lewinella sp. JB7]MCP9234449.1 hypothetical protein [Lewinella sp. JB7]
MTPQIRFSHFVDQFPPLKLPITFGEETVRKISKETPPLPPRMIDQFLVPMEPTQINEEFTEFIACMRLPDADEYVGLVYWRADLAQYHYTLVTINPKTEEVIDRLILAGTSYDGSELTQTSAAITDALMIYQVSGQGGGQDFDYQASGSTARRFQLADSGKIIEL